jgi:diguanylate cyclase
VLGHERGDEVLAQVADRLRAVLPAGAPVAGMGGDELVVAWAGGRGEALPLADRIRGIFAEPFRAAGTDVTVTASIGMAHGAVADESAATVPDLLHQADVAMYLAKREGSGSVTVRGSDRRDEARKRIELEAELRTAPAEGPLCVAYQPIVQLDTGHAHGAEVLGRPPGVTDAHHAQQFRPGASSSLSQQSLVPSSGHPFDHRLDARALNLI